MSDQTLVFVFGTLKEGFPNFQTNRGRRIPGEYRTAERFPLYLIGERMSPWMIDAAGEGEYVEGQLFSVDTETLAAMDLLERIHEANGYRRIEINVKPTIAANGEEIVAFAYVKPPASLEEAHIRKGPMPRYALEDAALYRRRAD